MRAHTCLTIAFIALIGYVEGILPIKAACFLPETELLGLRENGIDHLDSLFPSHSIDNPNFSLLETEHEALALDSRVKNEIREKKKFGEWECNAEELRSPGPGPRTASIFCTHKDGRRITCAYRGNPHGSSKYNNGGQVKFYHAIRDFVGNHVLQNGQCYAQTLGLRELKRNAFADMDYQNEPQVDTPETPLEIETKQQVQNRKPKKKGRR